MTSVESAESAANRPCIRVEPEDFIVEELALYEPCGEGEHTFVQVEKRLRNTDEVLADLARAAGVARREVGCAGRKDRRAVTRQWFSVPHLDPEAALDLPLTNARVLAAVRHRNKLRTGHLRANRFAVRVSNLTPAAIRKAASRLDEMCAVGMPNRFGDQRFGRLGDNSERGRAILATEGRVRGDLRAARFMVSALQSAVFNATLAARPLSLDRVEGGDVACVVASGGLFLVEDAVVENLRAATFEISATGPIFGTRMKRAEGAVARREAGVMSSLELPALDELRAPKGIRLEGTRRALRVRPEDAELEEGDQPESEARRAVVVRFTLPPGSYATVLLEELFGEIDEHHPAKPRSEQGSN